MNGRDVSPQNNGSSLLKGESSLKPNHTKVSGRRIGLTPDDQRRMAEMYVDGLSCQKIADAFGCSRRNVSQTLKKLSVKKRSGGTSYKIRENEHPRVIQMYESGQSSIEIAGEFGCTATCILHILRKHDVKRRPRNSPGKFSDEICRKMIDLYKEGYTQINIAARFGCCTHTVKRIFDEYGVERRPSPPPPPPQPVYTEQDQQRMVSMYENGKSQRKIAKEIGCSQCTITRIFKKLGVKVRPSPPRHKVTPEERQMIVRLREQGKSYSEIAAKIGCCREHVNRIMRQLKTPVRVQSPDAYSPEDHRRMVDAYESGISLEEISAGFGCGRKTVILVLRKHGVKIRPRGGVAQLPPKQQERIVAMYESGFSGAEIAEKFDCGLAAVASVIDIALRKSRIVERMTFLPDSKIPGNFVMETKFATSKPTSQISFEALVRNFWSDETRAVDVLLLPPEHRLMIIESVKQALSYASETLGRQ